MIEENSERKASAYKKNMMLASIAAMLFAALFYIRGEAAAGEFTIGTEITADPAAQVRDGVETQVQDKAEAQVQDKAEAQVQDKAEAQAGIAESAQGQAENIGTAAVPADSAPAAASGPDAQAFRVTPYPAAKALYAVTAVNVRQGPSTDYGKLGTLARGQTIAVSGQADSGWYEVDFNNTKAYVSNEYLQEQQPAAQPAPAAGVIFVGDSRTVQMQNAVGDNPYTWIAESGKGYQWLNDTGIGRVDNNVGQGSRIILNLGVNDINNINNYIALVNAKAAEWIGKGAVVYYASVNPVTDNVYVTDEQVTDFNAKLQAGLIQDIYWIDSNNYLRGIGFKLVDGLHFNKETYQNLYNYYLSCL